jgi:hypothetical protein
MQSLQLGPLSVLTCHHQLQDITEQGMDPIEKVISSCMVVFCGWYGQYGLISVLQWSVYPRVLSFPLYTEGTPRLPGSP